MAKSTYSPKIYLEWLTNLDQTSQENVCRSSHYVVAPTENKFGDLLLQEPLTLSAAGCENLFLQTFTSVLITQSWQYESQLKQFILVKLNTVITAV